MASDNDPIPSGFRRDLIRLLPPDMSWIMVGELLDKSRPLIEDNAVMEWYTRVANRVLARGEKRGRAARSNLDDPPAMRLSAGRRHLIVRTLKSGIGIDVECNDEDGLKTAFRLIRQIQPPAIGGRDVVHVRIDSVTIGDRVRKDYGDIGTLAESIRTIGLLQPIAVTPEPHQLIWGARRLRAYQLLGLEKIPARIVKVDAARAEIDENQVRKDFTVSERVAIAEVHCEQMKSRQGARTDRLRQNFAEVRPGERTREVVARLSGFGNAETLRQAKQAVDSGVPELIELMDAGLSISRSYKIAKMTPDEQRKELAGLRCTAPSRPFRASAEPVTTESFLALFRKWQATASEDEKARVLLEVQQTLGGPGL